MLFYNLQVLDRRHWVCKLIQLEPQQMDVGKLWLLVHVGEGLRFYQECVQRGSLVSAAQKHRKLYRLPPLGYPTKQALPLSETVVRHQSLRRRGTQKLHSETLRIGQKIRVRIAKRNSIPLAAFYRLHLEEHLRTRAEISENSVLFEADSWNTRAFQLWFRTRSALYIAWKSLNSFS